MLSIAEAHEHIRRCVRPLASRRLPLGDLLGLPLAEPVVSQVDSPPFDKAQVDGYAVAVDDKSATLRETELVVAGETPRRAVTPGTTIRVMTGAPLPDRADAVVKWEDCRTIDEHTIRNPAAATKPGANVLRRGAAFRRGELVLEPGRRLSPLDIALLAEVGQAEVAVIPRPRVGVLPTGDELVAPDQTPGPGQIRNSNGPMLIAALTAAGATAIDLGVARDNVSDLREKIGLGLECDVLLASGGVSAGVKDLAPGVLEELGVRPHFHQVRMKPGKPLWFGVRESASDGDKSSAARDRDRTLVFGLPGNPVSTLATFQLFVLPALRALAGEAYRPSATERAVLSKPFKHRGGRPTYHPCRFVNREPESYGGLPCIEPLDWRGSADLATLTRASCWGVFPEGDYELPAGAEVETLAL